MVLAFDPTAVIVAVITALFGTSATGYLLGRRLTSGRVRTTNADRLWTEADRIRDVYLADLKRLREDEESASREMFSLRGQVIELKDLTARSRREALRWKIEAGTSTARAVASDVEIVRLNDLIDRLRSRSGGGS